MLFFLCFIELVKTEARVKDIPEVPVCGDSPTRRRTSLLGWAMMMVFHAQENACVPRQGLGESNIYPAATPVFAKMRFVVVQCIT